MKRLILSGLLVATPAFAADPATPGERRLSPEQVQQVLDQAAARREATERAQPRIKPIDISGEVGVAVGTGGTRSAYGAASIGFGGGGFANIGVESGTARVPDPFDPAYGSSAYGRDIDER